MKKFTKHPIAKVTGIAIVIAVFISFLFLINFYSNIELALNDNLYGGITPLDSIIIISIDDKSIQEIGRWPWSRQVFADVLPALNQSKVIGIDVAFFEPQSEEVDQALADSIKTAGNVVLPVEYKSFEVEDNRVIAKEMLVTIPELTGAAAGLGYINVITDHDGKTRAINPNVIGDYESFAYEVYKNYWNVPIRTRLEEIGNRFLINYAGPTPSFKQYSFVDVLNNKIEPSEFNNKLVLMGVTSPDLHDEALVPNSAKPMPGVEIHANTIQTMITQNFLTKEPDWLIITSIFIAAIATALIFYFLPVWLAPIIMLIVLLGYLFFTIIMFNFGLILNIMYVPMSIIISYLVVSVYYYVSEKKQRKKVFGAFEKYVSKDVIKHILEHPDRLKLGGERRKITIFFSDIRGFTAISEKLKPERLVKLLNEYLTEMTDIILANDGVVDKYMGDAIMAFWGAPLEQPKHAERGCKAALEMETRLKQLQVKWKKEKVPRLEIGIGLNSGDAVVGNMGSLNRFDYTAMGDTINLGSRLEGLNKMYGTRILISESTRKLIDKKPFIARKLDAVRVKGKKEPVMIYELVSKKEDAKDWFIKVISHFEKGLEYYFKQNWSKAITEFETALKYRKNDVPSKVFIERCKLFKKYPPGKRWDGVWIMKEK